MKTVFFYGLFMDEDLLREKGLNPSLVNLVHVDGYGLRIGNRATLVASNEERAYGTAIQISEDELTRLYGSEGVEDYIPMEINVTDFNGKTLTAVCYILPEEKLSGQNKKYAASLATVARKLDLPESYITEIETWASDRAGQTGEFD